MCASTIPNCFKLKQDGFGILTEAPECFNILAPLSSVPRDGAQFRSPLRLSGTVALAVPYFQLATILPLVTMSDSEGDISDELLELAGATERKRKKRQAQSKSSASKRRKAE